MAEVGVVRSRFGNRVRKRLAQIGMTVAELAELSKLPPGRLGKILDGTYVRITITDMDTIAGVLETPLYGLMAPPELSIGFAPFDLDEA